MSMNCEQVIVEARAKIVWGDAPSSVHYFLTSNGMSAGDADSKVKELVAERNKEIRKTGIRGICIGAAIVCGAALWLCYELEHPSKLFPSRQGKAIFFLILIGLYGAWRLANGLIYLLRPQSEKRSVGEISE